MAVLIGAVPTFAQSGSSYGTSKKTTTGDTTTTGTTTTDTTRRAGAPSSADVDSTKEINAQTGTGMAREKLSWGDRRFVTKAADAGTDEVQMAQLAAQRATNPEVRSFAQKLAGDHEKVNTELTEIAGQKNVKLDADDGMGRAYKRLDKKAGAEFDQEFVEHMIDEHEKAVKLFEKAASDAKDPEIRSFASKHVTHLRDHLQQAQNLRATVMPTGRVDDYSGRSTPGSRSATDPTTSGTSTTTPRSSTTPGPSSTDSSTTPRRDGSR
jgi:putative membrane protein